MSEAIKSGWSNTGGHRGRSPRLSQDVAEARSQVLARRDAIEIDTAAKAAAEAQRPAFVLRSILELASEEQRADFRETVGRLSAREKVQIADDVSQERIRNSIEGN